MLEDRYTEIERENRILLEKMTNIMQNKTLYGSAGNIMKKSLNKEARKRELLKITMENQSILRRLQDKNSYYNVSKWENDEISRKRMLSNICEYPYLLEQMSITQSMHTSQTGHYNSGPPDFIIKKKKNALTSQPFYKKRGYTNDVAKKQVLYQGRQSLGDENGANFDVEIFLSQKDDLIVTALHVERTDSFVIEIEASKVAQLAGEFQNDYADMAEHLKIMNKRMVLLNPKFINKQSKSASPDKPEAMEEGVEEESAEKVEEEAA